MKNYVQKGEVLTLTAPYDLKSGEGVKIGGIFGVACHDAASGEPVDIARVHIFDLAKKAGQAVGEGGRLYWDAATKSLTTIAAEGDEPVAHAAAVAEGGAVTVRALLG